jgi:hypothetical protein
MITEIKLLIGFAALPFGSGRRSALELFGEPEEIQELSDELLNNRSLVYHYWDLGFSLFFDLNKEQIFSSAEVDNREAVLFDTKIFTLKEKELVQLMLSKGFRLSDTEVQNWGEKRLSFDQANLDCYFENNKMVSLNFGMPEHSGAAYQYFPN